VVRVTTVGSGDAFGSGGRFQTCIALAAVSAIAPSVLLDCGASSLTALCQQQIDPNQIEAVLVSHLHGDHFGGLPFLVLDGQFRGRTHDLTIFGPPGTGTRLEQAMEVLFPGSSSVQRGFAVHIVEHVDRRSRELGLLRVTAYEVRHASGAPAYALRVDGPNASVAYSGDSEWTEPLLDAADNVDLFLCEGYSLSPCPLASRPRHPRPPARQAHLPPAGAHSPVLLGAGQRPERLGGRPRRLEPRCLTRTRMPHPGSTAEMATTAGRNTRIPF